MDSFLSPHNGISFCADRRLKPGATRCYSVQCARLAHSPGDVAAAVRAACGARGRALLQRVQAEGVARPGKLPYGGCAWVAG